MYLLDTGYSLRMYQWVLCIERMQVEQAHLSRVAACHAVAGAGTAVAYEVWLMPC